MNGEAINGKGVLGNIKNLFLKVDWKLFLFLILFLNVKMVVKVIAIVLIYALRFNVRFGFRLRLSRIPLFYVAVIIIGVLNLALHTLYANFHYDTAFLTGVFFWVLCILAIHQLKLSVDTMDAGMLQNTLVAFFAVNAVVSFADVLAIIIETGAYNPYQYQGLFQKYFIGTGDYVKGILFDTSTTNALINAFGVVYFLSRKQVLMTLLCMVVLLLTGSNLTNLLLIAVLAGRFFFQANRNQKSVISVCLFLLILFLVKVSPQNKDYALAILNKTFHRQDAGVKAVQPAAVILNPVPVLNPEEEKQKKAQSYLDSLKVPYKSSYKERPFVPQPDINSREYQNIDDATSLRRALLAFAERPENRSLVFPMGNKWEKLPGKIIAMQQTQHFLQQSPIRFAIGSGMGNFSSKLAFRVTALNLAGGYPAKYAYINQAFRENHLALFIYYFMNRAELHSVFNTPDSVYDQLLGEYGIIGFLSFIFFYIVYFTRHLKRLTYGIPLLFIMAGAFCMGYWFEQLSVVVLFELLLLADIRSGQQPVIHKREME